MNSTFCVFVATPQLPPLMDLAKPYAQFRGLLVPDAVPLLKPRSGLIEENLNQEDARRLSEILTSAGFPNAIIPSERMAPTLTAHTLAAIQIGENGFSVSVLPGAWQTIPWSAFGLMAAGIFKETMVHLNKSEQGPSAQEKLVKAGILLTTGIPLPMSKKKTIQTKTEETNLHPILDLFLIRPEMRLRVDGQKLDYQFLGEKMGVSAQENFRTLLRELSARLPGVRQNAALAQILAVPPKPLIYSESERIFDQECRWLLTQQRLA